MWKLHVRGISRGSENGRCPICLRGRDANLMLLTRYEAKKCIDKNLCAVND
jgi:hypothetical protein